MGTLECKDFSTQADEVMTPNNAKVEMVNVGGQRVMKISAKPGWKWSTDIKPVVGTESCQAKHVGVIVEGSITCRHDDGSEMTYSAFSLCKCLRSTCTMTHNRRGQTKQHSAQTLPLCCSLSSRRTRQPAHLRLDWTLVLCRAAAATKAFAKASPAVFAFSWSEASFVLRTNQLLWKEVSTGRCICRT
jgi:hypothetical protein